MFKIYNCDFPSFSKNPPNLQYSLIFNIFVEFLQQFSNITSSEGLCEALKVTVMNYYSVSSLEIPEQSLETRFFERRELRDQFRGVELPDYDCLCLFGSISAFHQLFLHLKRNVFFTKNIKNHAEVENYNK